MEIQELLAILDLTLTTAEKIGSEIDKRRKTGEITVEEQQALRDRFNALRARVNLDG